LGVEGKDLLARLGARGMAVVVKAGAHGRRPGREALPEAACRLASDPMHGGRENDPGAFTVPEARVEAFEPLEFVDHALRHPALPLGGGDTQAFRPQAEHALLGKTTLEAPPRFRMRPGLLGPLGSGARRIEEQRADEFIPLWRGIE
jgi:hypothetical protein